MDRNDDFGDKVERGFDRTGDAIDRGLDRTGEALNRGSDRTRDTFTDDDDQYYRGHYSSLGRSDTDYDRAQTGYRYGHTAGTNESYSGRSYDDVENDLRRDYSGDDYDQDRDYIRHGYERSSQRFTTGGSTTGGVTTDSGYTGTTTTNRTEDDPSAGDLVGEAAGGISGVLTGAALGSMGGPVGTIIGGIAGAVGGWWTGRAVSEAASSYTDEDEAYYRSHYDSSRSDDLDYDTARTGYQLGHIAGGNPDYQNRSYDEVEPDLRRGWGDQDEDYTRVRDYARHGYERSSQRFRTGGSTGGTGTGSGGATQRDRDVGVGDDSGIGSVGGAGTTGGTMNDRSLGGGSGGSGGVASTQQAGEFGKAGPMGTGNYGQNTGL